VSDAVVYLVPVGAGRFDFYAEPPDDHVSGSRLHRLQEWWRAAVHSARQQEPPPGWFARVRHWTVRRGAEMIAEQRTLWSLRHVAAATLVYPSHLSDPAAGAVRDRLLGHARRHHGRWLLVDLVLFTLSGVFFLVPGPNVIAYYCALRVVGHFLSWRGACQAIDRTRWQLRPEPALTELAALADAPRDARAARVDAIAAGLHLPRLAIFFDRCTAPARR
jgi:K+-H+ exchange-related protein